MLFLNFSENSEHSLGRCLTHLGKTTDELIKEFGSSSFEPQIDLAMNNDVDLSAIGKNIFSCLLYFSLWLSTLVL